MKEQQLLYAIGWVKDEFLEEMGQPAMPHKTFRWIYLLTAAILISLLGIGVYAAEHMVPADYWLYHYFSGQQTQEDMERLTENQQIVLDRALVRIGQSVQDSGYTVTLESGISDGKRAFLKFIITAPEGTILDGEGYDLRTKEDADRPHQAQGKYSMRYQGGEFLDDGNPTDNIVWLLQEDIFLPPKDTSFSLSDGTVWTVHFDSIVEYGTHDGEPTEKILAEGNWDYEVTFSEDFLATQSVELLQHPVWCSAKRSWRTDSYDIKVKVTSFQLRPLSATLCYQKPLTGFWEGVTLDPIYLVMTDGSRVKAQFKMGINRGSYMENTFLFDRPISIEDVVSVDYPGARE